MFYKLRLKNPKAGWVILAFKPSVLLDYHCLFCWENAARNEFSRADDAKLSGIAALKDLFSERPGEEGRDEQCLNIADPTHVQAEVLAKGVIDPKYIFGVIFQSYSQRNQYKSLIGTRAHKVTKSFEWFSDRGAIRKAARK